MNTIGPATTRASECEEILRSLPEWFGIEESLQMYVRDSEAHPTFALEESDRLVAFLTVREHFAESWEIHCIAVASSHRNQGLGTRLLDHAEGWLVSKGVRFLQVKTLAATSSDVNYAKTREFYLARGFTPLEIFPELWCPSNPALVMIKTLPSH